MILRFVRLQTQLVQLCTAVAQRQTATARPLLGIIDLLLTRLHPVVIEAFFRIVSKH